MHVSGSIVSTEHNFSGGLDMAEMTVLENLTSLSIPGFKVSERMSYEEFVYVYIYPPYIFFLYSSN